MTSTTPPTTAQGPYRIPGNERVTVSAQHAAALDDDTTRVATAMLLAEPIAKREAMEQAFTTPEQLASTEQLYASLPADERAALGATTTTTDLQAAVFAQPQGYARNTFVDAVRERAGLVGAALPVDEGSVDMRAAEIEQSLIEQSFGPRLTDEQRARGIVSGMGMVRAVGGLAEMGVGGIAAVTPTGVGQVAGAVVVAHGFDTAQAGVRQMLGGEPVQNVTEQAIAAGARRVGVDPATAATIGSVGDGVVGLVLPWTLARTATTAGKIVDDVLHPATHAAADDVTLKGTTPRAAAVAIADASPSTRPSEVDLAVQLRLAQVLPKP